MPTTRSSSSASTGSRRVPSCSRSWPAVWTRRRMARPRTPSTRHGASSPRRPASRPGRGRRSASFYSAPGFTEELMHLFLATDLRPIEESAAQDEDERLIVDPDALRGRRWPPPTPARSSTPRRSSGCTRSTDYGGAIGDPAIRGGGSGHPDLRDHRRTRTAPDHGGVTSHGRDPGLPRVRYRTSARSASSPTRRGPSSRSMAAGSSATARRITTT